MVERRGIATVYNQNGVPKDVFLKGVLKTLLNRKSCKDKQKKVTRQGGPSRPATPREDASAQVRMGARVKARAEGTRLRHGGKSLTQPLGQSDPREKNTDCDQKKYSNKQ